MQRLPIDQKKVDALITQCKHFNVFPIFLARYFPGTKPHPISDLLAELIEECVQYLSIMSDDEIDILIDELPPALKMLIDRKATMGRDNILLERIALNYIVAMAQESYVSFREVVASDIGTSEVLKTYPELRERVDGDGLLYIDGTLKLFDGGIEYRDHILHYHQFLRRGYASNPNFDFLGRFIRYYLQTGKTNQFRIAIDHARLMPKEFYRQIVELDRWFGPGFDRSKLDDPHAVGLTIQKRIRPSIFDLTNRLDRTEFYWSYRNGIKTLEIEEISSKGYTFGPYYLNRYAHSERDIEQGILRHFDGAVKVYLQDSYAKRLESKMPTEFKSHKKVKLFRIDGDIDIEEWTGLLAHFYKANEMIIEYLDPERFEELFGDRMREYRNLKQNSVI